MHYYFDSSGLVKRYTAEKGTAWVRAVVDPPAENVLYLAQIAIVEVAAALSKKVRTGELSPRDYAHALGLFLADVASGAYVIVPLSEVLVESAVDLTRRHPLRGYDAVNLATAMDLSAAVSGASLPALVFVSADSNLCNAARQEGLATENPNLK